MAKIREKCLNLFNMTEQTPEIWQLDFLFIDRMRQRLQSWVAIFVFFLGAPASPAALASQDETVFRLHISAEPSSLDPARQGSADTGYFYVTKKNSRTKTDKLSFKKYDPIARKHVEFKETKIK